MGNTSLVKNIFFSDLYMGDAVSAIKKLAQTEIKEEETESSSSLSFQNFDELFHPRNFDCEIIPKTPGGPATGMSKLRINTLFSY